MVANYFAERGYVFVAMDVRGRGDSEGAFVPYINEGQDGFDAIEWCAEQPWSDGNVGTIGSSYPGVIQWLAALQQPPHLKVMVVRVAPSDPFVETPTGVPSLIEPGKMYHYTIDCWNTSQIFKAGHRIGLEISSSAFPKFDRNLNTGAPLGMTTEMAVAEQRIYHDAEHPSAVMLPVIPKR